MISHSRLRTVASLAALVVVVTGSVAGVGVLHADGPGEFADRLRERRMDGGEDSSFEWAED